MEHPRGWGAAYGRWTGAAGILALVVSTATHRGASRELRDAAAASAAVAPAEGAIEVEGALWPGPAERRDAASGRPGEFGAAVALTGSIALVGAPRASDAGVRRGLVHVARRSPSGRWSAVPGSPWSSAGLKEGARFGASLAAGAGLVAIGAPGADAGGGARSGAVDLFRIGPRSGGGQRSIRLVPPPGHAGAAFGAALAIDARSGRRPRVVVGAPTLDAQAASGPVPAAGAVFVFERTTCGWVLTRTLRAPAPAVAAGFGSSVAVVGRAVVIGAPGDGREAPGAGRVYGFLDGASPAWELALVGDVAGARYGTSVEGVGARELAIGVPGRGAVEIVRLGETGPYRVDLLRGDPLGRFGERLAAGGGILCVGAPVAVGGRPGRVECFEQRGGAWRPASPLVPGPATGEGSFGSALAVVGAATDAVRVLVGEPLSDRACPDGRPACGAGRAVLFRIRLSGAGADGR